MRDRSFARGDGDGDVDLADYGLFEACMAGPVDAMPSGCEWADLDENAAVDLADFAIFQVSFGS